jgi:hypothetical protein
MKMRSKSGIIFILLVAALIALVDFSYALAQPAAGGDGNDIWTQEQGPGGRPGRGRGGPGRGRPELTEDEINRIMAGLKQRDPEKAKELEELRQKDPEKFRAELREHGREVFGEIFRERMDKWRQERQAEFLKWLEEKVPKEADELAGLKKEGDTELYAKKYELARRKYGRIADTERRNPELAEILLADLKLQERRDELVDKIKAATNEKEKKQLVSQLEEVVSDRYDFILRRKQMMYEWLLRRLEELQKQVNESKNEIAKLRDKQVKAENVKERMKQLTEGTTKLKWD